MCTLLKFDAAATPWVAEATLAGVSATIFGIIFDAIVDGPDSELLAEVPERF